LAIGEAAEAIAEPVKAGIRPRQQPSRPAARRLVTVLIPIAIVPLRELGVSTRTRPLGRLIPWHCLSVPALSVRLIAVIGSLVHT
jgi:hypothetical protein